MSPRYSLLALAAACLLFALPAHAVRERDQPVAGAIDLTGLVRVSDPVRQAERNASPAWRGFAARHNGWRATWNERAGTPHRAFGPGIELGVAPRDAAAVDRAVRDFVAQHPTLFGGRRTLETAHVARAGRLWYVRYRETVGGIPVLFQDWEFRVDQSGRLVAFGVDAYPVSFGPITAPTRTGMAAREAAIAGLELDRTPVRIEGGESLYLLPVPTEDGVEHRLVTEVRVEAFEPRASWITLVDARTGEVLWRHDRVRHDIGGTVQGDVHLLLPTDVLALRPFARERVTVGPSNVITDPTGAYFAPAAGTVTVSSQLAGPFCDVNRNDFVADAVFSTSATDPSTVDLTWSALNAHDSERDAFYHVNLVHDWVKTLDPAFTGNDYVMPCIVNINATCNAFWDGTGVNFYLAGGGCPNTATMPDVVYHEYGHGVNDNQYVQAGAPFGMTNGALHEGMADVLAAFVQDDPGVGKGFFGPGTILRTIDNTNRYPADLSGDTHVTGLIVAGAFWDLRQAIGLAGASRLAHFARYGIPDDLDDGIAMNEYFVETILADDDDANLANGTPNDDAIVAAFNAHGIGTGFWIDVTHAPLDDQSLPGPYPLVAEVTYIPLVPIGGLSGAPQLFYSTDGVAFSEAAMAPTGAPDEFEGQIPAQTAAIVRYYLRAADDQGGEMTHPEVAPSNGAHLFIAGPATPVLSHDLESDPAWTVGAPGDGATTGIWLRADPVGTDVGGTLVQPEFDHSADPGALCFVTGNATPGAPAGTNDVDAGHTTLTTGVFDATVGGITQPILEYYRWYSNDAGSTPGTDSWRTWISNDDGASWALVEDTKQSDASWRRVVFFIEDYMTPTATMRMRFVAADSAEGSLIEAGVDDLRLLGFAPSTDVAGSASASWALSAGPSPFTTSSRIGFALAASSRVRLHVFDAGGRLVRDLVDEAFPAGPHSVTWDGRDEHGATVARGLYFVRLVAGSEYRRLSLVRLQ
jgi:hypothetical protein